MLEINAVAAAVDPLQVRCGALILNAASARRSNLWQRLNVGLNGRLDALETAGEIPRGQGEVCRLDTPEEGIQAQRLVFVEIGERAGISETNVALSRAFESVARVDAVAVALATLPLALEAGTRSTVEAALLSAYRFDRFRTQPPTLGVSRLSRLLLIGGSDEAAAAAVVVVNATNRARDLQNLPPNHLGPADLAKRATVIADNHPRLSVEIHGEDWLRARGWGAFSAVAQGGAGSAKLIVLRHDAASPSRERPVLGLVGKGITFDTGGLVLKPARGLVGMKFDMSGAAVVLEATAAIAELGLPIDVITVVGAAENLPGAGAYRPDDVITARNGRTIEVRDTDAEGRLVLADCLDYVGACGATHVIDVATLTEAAGIALGDTHAALFGNDQAFSDLVRGAGEATGDRAWQLPLTERHRELLASAVADLVNEPARRLAGASVAARFLQEFVGERPWVHLDIAVVASRSSEQAGTGAPGGTGWGVRLLVEAASQLAAAVS
jgi:leucyl aminopeptidase